MSGLNSRLYVWGTSTQSQTTSEAQVTKIMTNFGSLSIHHLRCGLQQQKVMHLIFQSQLCLVAGPQSPRTLNITL